MKRIRDKERTREKILNTAFQEIFRRGFQAVTVQEIVDKTEMTKGAFFHHFPTKQILGYAVVDETLRDLVLNRWIRPLEEYENPVDGIISNFRKIILSTPEEDLSLGCPLNNLIQEMSTIDPVFSEKLQKILEVWIDGIDKYLAKAKKRGYLPSKTNTHRLAEFVVMNHEGAFGISKGLKSRKAFLSMHASLRDYLKRVADDHPSKSKVVETSA